MISLIVAVADNGVIGRDKQLPWRLPEDLKFFKRTTLGAPVVMGRRTWESIGRPLPGRRCIVVTRNAQYEAHGASVANSLDEALAVAGDCDEVFVIGGAALYAQAMPRANRLYLTEVHADVYGDTTFPTWDRSLWRELRREDHPADDAHEHPFSLVVLEKRGVDPGAGASTIKG